MCSVILLACESIVRNALLKFYCIISKLGKQNKIQRNRQELSRLRLSADRTLWIKYLQVFR